jgi:hypothetical protein
MRWLPFPIITFIGALMITGCAGRQPIITSSKDPKDLTLTCAQIASEIGGTNWEMRNKARESLHTSAKNMDAVVKTFPFGLMMLLALDTTDAAGTELEAFGARSRTLEALGQSKNCDSPHALTVAEAIEEEAGERKRLPGAGHNIVEVGTGRDGPDGPDSFGETNTTRTATVQPFRSPSSDVAKPRRDQPSAASSPPSPGATTSKRRLDLRDLMKMFLSGEITREQYQARRDAIRGG